MNMLSRAMVDKIKQMLEQGNLSNREIARKLGVSRGTVDSISSGARRDHCREDTVASNEPPNEEGLCDGCGHVVPLPCVYCAAEAYGRQQGGNRSK